MLRHGVPLDQIGMVLRHRGIDTTAYYAKYLIVIDAERTLLANQLLLTQTVNLQMAPASV